MKDITDTLKSYFRAAGLSQNKMADMLGTSQAYVNSMLNAKSPFGRAAARRWEEVFGISASWLMTGEGEMLVEQPRDGLSGTVDLSSHHVSGGGNVVASGSATVQQTGTNSAVTEMLARQNEMLARQNEMLARQNEMLMKSIDRLTQQLGMLMQERTTAKRDDNNYNEPTGGK